LNAVLKYRLTDLNKSKGIDMTMNFTGKPDSEIKLGISKVRVLVGYQETITISIKRQLYSTGSNDFSKYKPKFSMKIMNAAP